MARSPRVVGLACLLTMVVSILVPRTGSAGVPRDFVTRRGATLLVNGTLWRAIGVNLWDMDASAALRGDVTGCYYQHADIDDYLNRSFSQIARSMHATVVRTFGFRASYTNGGRDWSATDKLVYYAQKYGVRIIPVFGDQYATCGQPVKSRAWYRTGYRSPDEPWGVSFRSYVVAAARRYAANPTIAMWQLMNEADMSVDPAAVNAFSADMARAIRAVDPNHMINLGTATANRPAFDATLSCARGGGCNDIAEAHVFDPTTSMPGAPLNSRVGALIVFWNDKGDRKVLGYRRPQIEGWTPMSATPEAPRHPFTHWAIQVSAPASRHWATYLDNVQVTTSSGVALYSFESGLDGFTGQNATLTRSAKHAADGSSSLRALSPSSAQPRTFMLTAPPFSGQIQKVTLQSLVSMRAPGLQAGGGVAAMEHAAVIDARKPFLLGEAGFRAAVPGISRCAQMSTLTERAEALSSLMVTQMDSERAAQGVIVWDWKDPAIKTTTARGELVPDPTVDCWTLTPGDPAVGTVAHFARVVPRAPLPAPRPLPRYPYAQAVLVAPGAEIARGTPIPIAVRITRGGDAVVGMRVTSSGCAGSGTTDALGMARFTCSTRALGPVSVRIGCACAPAQRFQTTSRRAVFAAISGSVARAGARAPLTITLSEPGGSLAGVSWSVPGCASGTVRAAVPGAVVRTSCSTAGWDGSRLLTLRIAGSPTTQARTQPFGAAAVRSVYMDAKTGECVGLSPATGWVAATTSRSSCVNGVFSMRDAFVFRVPAAARAQAFSRKGSTLLVKASSGPLWRVEGAFEDPGSSFAAVLTRSGVSFPISG